jgi:hypothetical protein
MGLPLLLIYPFMGETVGILFASRQQLAAAHRIPIETPHEICRLAEAGLF